MKVLHVYCTAAAWVVQHRCACLMHAKMQLDEPGIKAKGLEPMMAAMTSLMTAAGNARSSTDPSK